MREKTKVDKRDRKRGKNEYLISTKGNEVFRKAFV